MPRRKDLRRQQRDEARAIVLEAAKSNDKAKGKAAILAARLMESIDSEFAREEANWRQRAMDAEQRIKGLEQWVQELEQQAPKPPEPDGPKEYRDVWGRLHYSEPHMP